MKQTEQLKITFVGSINLEALTKSEQRVFYYTFLARIQELCQNSKINGNGV